MENDNNEDNILVENTKWSPDHEKILVEWADKALCYRWLHAKSNLAYSNMHAWFTIPCIILSTLTGTASFAFQKYPPNIQDIASNVIGGINLLVGILSTITQFLKISEYNEAHRVSSISWDKFYRNIKVELSKHPDERIDPLHMLKVSKEEYDRLIETSPIIKEDIIQKFKNTFDYRDDEIKQREFEDIKKPEICNELISTNKFRHEWYLNVDDKAELINRIKELNELKNKENENRIKEIEELERNYKLKELSKIDEIKRQEEIKKHEEIMKEQEELIRQQHDLLKQEEELIKNEEFKKNQEIQNIRNKYINTVNTFKQSFKEYHNRNPLENELIDNLKDEVPIDHLNDIINTHSININ